MIAASFDRRFSVSGKRLGPGVVAGLTALFFCAAATPARASFQFSDWLTQPASSATVAWNYDSGTGTATLSGSVPVNYRFDNIPSLPTGLQPATLTITATTSVMGSVVGSLITEPLSGTISISNGANLLTIAFVGSITGQQSGGSATVSADVTVPGDSVTFSSDFMTFLNPSGNSFQLSLPSVTPGLTLNPSGFISNFTSNVQGSASVTSVNALDPIPEPASLVSVCTGLAAAGFFMAARRRRKPG